MAVVEHRDVEIVLNEKLAADARKSLTESSLGEV
jgi:hypothetical protein